MESLAAQPPSSAGSTSRRAFVTTSATIAGGLMLSATVPIAAFAPRAAVTESNGTSITVYARFARSGAVTIIAPNRGMRSGRMR
jgi:hypothetical protein